MLDKIKRVQAECDKHERLPKKVEEKALKALREYHRWQWPAGQK